MQGGRRKVAEVVVVAVVCLTACSGGGPKTTLPSPSTGAPTSSVSTSAATTTETTTPDPTKAAILAAYRAHWDDVIAVAESFPVHPLDPRLSTHAIGKQLTSEQQALTRLSLLNHYNRGPTDLSPVVTSIIGDTATVTDCIFDHSVEVDYRTNTPVESPNVGHTRDNFTLIKVTGAWYVSDSTVTGSGKTAEACTPSVA